MLTCPGYYKQIIFFAAKDGEGLNSQQKQDQELTVAQIMNSLLPNSDVNSRKKWYIYTMEYYSAIKKNTFESVLMWWMKLEPIIQSEVSQKEKHQYSILMHIYGI